MVNMVCLSSSERVLLMLEILVLPSNFSIFLSHNITNSYLCPSKKNPHKTLSQVNPATLAYLNYLYFDTDMTLVSSGFSEVTDAARGTGAHEYLGIKGFVATKPGRLLVYLSNENDMPLPIHFDDLTITHRVAPAVVQSDDYYPFGLTFNSYGKGLGEFL